MALSPLALTTRIASAVDAGRKAARNGASDNPFDDVDESLRIAFHYGWMLEQPMGSEVMSVEWLLDDAKKRAAAREQADADTALATLAGGGRSEARAPGESTPVPTVDERLKNALAFAAESLNEVNVLAIRDMLRALIAAHPALSPEQSFDPVIEVAARVCHYVAMKPSPLFDTDAWCEASDKCAFLLRRLVRIASADEAHADDREDDPNGAAARTNRILEMVEIYRRRPDRLNLSALRGFLSDEFEELLVAKAVAEREAPLFEEKIFSRAKQILDQFDAATAEPLIAMANYGETALTLLRAILAANSAETGKLSDIAVSGEKAPRPTPERLEEIYNTVPKCIDGTFNVVGFGEALLATFPDGVATGASHG